MALPLIISIQSQVMHGHVGNSAAVWPMRAAGVEVVEVPTALLSNHPWYPTMRGQVLDAALVADLLLGVEERGLPDRAAVILSGYLSLAETAEAVARFVARAKARNPRVIYACDPVMGDSDVGFYTPADLRAVFADRLVPMADLIFPNAFELGTLAGFPITAPDDVARARAVLGTATVVATSVPLPDRPDWIATVLATAEGLLTTPTPRLNVRPGGTGDLLAALTVARMAQGVPLTTAVPRAVAGVAAALRATAPDAWAEMPIAAEIAAILAG